MTPTKLLIIFKEKYQKYNNKFRYTTIYYEVLTIVSLLIIIFVRISFLDIHKHYST